MNAPAPADAPAPDVAQPAPDAPASGAEQQSEQAPSPKPASPEIEALAREMGWSPQDEYRGNPDQWIPPDEFVKRTAKINKAQRDKIDRMDETMRKMAETSERIMKDRLADQKRQLEQQFEAAVEVGDVRLAKHTQAQIAGLEKQADTGPSHADRFKAENPWFQSNKEATAYAIAVAGLEAENGANPDAQLKAAAEAVKKRFPELFPSDGPQRTPPALQGGSRQAPRAAKQYPPEVKRAAADFVRRGMAKNEAEYFAAYDKENG
jgi:hypothetical protein